MSIGSFCFPLNERRTSIVDFCSSNAIALNLQRQTQQYKQDYRLAIDGNDCGRPFRHWFGPNHCRLFHSIDQTVIPPQSTTSPSPPGVGSVPCSWTLTPCFADLLVRRLWLVPPPVLQELVPKQLVLTLFGLYWSLQVFAIQNVVFLAAAILLSLMASAHRLHFDVQTLVAALSQTHSPTVLYSSYSWVSVSFGSSKTGALCRKLDVCIDTRHFD